MIETQLHARRLVAVRHGVYLSAEAWPDTSRERHLVLGHAEQVANSGAVLSHQSAAVAWGLASPSWEDWHELPVCVTLRPGHGHGSQHRTAAHRVIDLPNGQVTRDRDGYEITSLARTATDLAAGRTLPEALVILDDAARHLVAGYIPRPRRTDYSSPRLAMAARGELLGTGRTSLASTIQLADPARESVAESLSAAHFTLAGFPAPTFQAPVQSPMGKLFPDFLWPSQRVIGEVDGAMKYDDRNAFVLEKQREQVLRDLGYIIVRWLAKEIMLTPWVVVDRVARALGL
jgi:very-short-patch-repair endonuclease